MTIFDVPNISLYRLMLMHWNSDQKYILFLMTFFISNFFFLCFILSQIYLDYFEINDIRIMNWFP